MVLFRAAMLGVMAMFPLAWCLSLGGGRADISSSSSSLLSLPHPQDLSQDDLRPFLSRQGNTASAGAPPSVADYTGYDKSEVLREQEDPISSSAYRLQEALSEAVAAAAAEGTGELRDGADASSPTADEGVTLEDLVPYDPEYYLYPAFLDRGDEAMAGSSSSSVSGINSLRKVRNSNRNNRSSSSSTNSNSNTNNNNNNKGLDHSSMAKRTWPNGFSRRRSSGLSLSIDASMKVLREALYMEIIRKKQRQQRQRAQHNKKLLNSIGKRDVTRQLQQEGLQGVYQRDQRK